ncbi:MAG: DMT family transporter [Bryobacteraceae bacterium]
MKTWRADLALVANALIWGATFIVVKEALAEVSTLLFLALRFSLAGAALWLLFRRRLRGAGGRAWRAGVLCGVFLFSGYAFQTFGLLFTTAPKSAFITGLSTALVPLLAAAVYRIRPRRLELAGVAVAMFGMGLMTLGSGETQAMGGGDLLTLGCAVAFAAHIVTLGHYSGDIGFEVLAVSQVAVCAALALGLFWWAEVPRIAWTPGVMTAVAITGLAATALAFTVQAWAQQYTTPTRTALIFTLEPVFAWATSYLLAGETLSGRGAAGALLILGGVLLVEMKPPGARLHPSR